jgi:hypothetical protein
VEVTIGMTDHGNVLVVVMTKDAAKAIERAPQLIFRSLGMPWHADVAADFYVSGLSFLEGPEGSDHVMLAYRLADNC